MECPMELAPLTVLFAIYLLLSDYRLSRIQRSIDGLTAAIPGSAE